MDNTVRQVRMRDAAHDNGCSDVIHGGIYKVNALCDQNREVMTEFSSLCIRGLDNHLPLKLFISLFQHFFDANVHKEIKKDRLIIESAVTAFERGGALDDLDTNKLFEMTKTVDAEFIKKSATPLFSIEIRYDDFSDIRKKRITSHLNMLFAILCNWHDPLPINEIVKKTFAEKDYREILSEFLHLYNVETKMLSNSIAFHGPARKLKELFAEKLFTIMEKAAGDVSAAYTRKVFTPTGSSGIKTGCNGGKDRMK